MAELFPGLLGRGLIEAPVPSWPARCRPRASPVYWAGASLKHVANIDRLAPPLCFPGLLGRGLIEALGRGTRPRPRTNLPRSTGPGPH